MHNYKSVLTYETECAKLIASTQILPVVIEYQAELAATVNAVTGTGGKAKTAQDSLAKVSALADDLAAGIKSLDEALEAHSTEKMKAAMSETRKAADALEGLVPAEAWPLPSYAEMLFLY
jgi:glutamine synthetase